MHAITLAFIFLSLLSSPILSGVSDNNNPNGEPEHISSQDNNSSEAVRDTETIMRSRKVSLMPIIKKIPLYLICLKEFVALLKICAHDLSALKKSPEFLKIKNDLKEILKLVTFYAPHIAATKQHVLKASGDIDTSLHELTELREVNIEVEPLIDLVKSFNQFTSEALKTLDQFMHAVHNNKTLQDLLA